MNKYLKIILLLLIPFVSFSQKFRKEIQNYSTVVSLVNSNFAPSISDKVFIKETNTIYDFDIASTEAHDGVSVIQQTGFAGRWIAIGVSGAAEDYYISATNSVTLNATAQTLLSITVTSSGKYEIDALLDFMLSYNQPIAYYIAKNGTSISQIKSGYQNTTVSGAITFTNGKAKVIVNLVAGDIITLRAYASFTSSTVGNREMFIKKIAGFLPIIDRINDKSQSNYIDIGEVRYQWGTEPSGANARTVIFPVAFKNTTYSFTANAESADYSSRTINLGTKTATNILVRVTAGGSGSNTSFQWMAIGLKP